MFTLRGRLALVNVAVLFIALILLAAIVMNQLVHDLYEQLDQRLQIASHEEMAWVKIVNNTPLFATQINEPHAQLGLDGFARLLDRQGHITAGLGAFDRTPVLPATLIAPPQGLVSNQTAQNGLPLRIYTRPVLANNRVVGYLQVADDQVEVQETIQQVRRSLSIGVPLTLLVSGLLSFVAARQALQPLTTMTHSAAAIRAEALDERLPVPKVNDEVQALALTFNTTLDRLATAFARQRRFTADASHELRTPVTAILGQAEFALRRSRSPEDYQQSLTRIQSEAERMQRLIGRMLSLARLESSRPSLAFTPTDVAYVVRTLIETLQPQAAAKGLTLLVDAPATLTMPTDADSLTQILLNLLENAIAYTDQGQVTLKLRGDADQVCLEISDTGRGIPAHHLPQIFQPFYRVDPARSRDQGRVGLGLALTYELVHLLGGTIEVASQPQIGTTFTLVLPAKPKQDSAPKKSHASSQDSAPHSGSGLVT